MLTIYDDRRRGGGCDGDGCDERARARAEVGVGAEVAVVVVVGGVVVGVGVVVMEEEASLARNVVVMMGTLKELVRSLPLSRSWD